MKYKAFLNAGALMTFPSVNLGISNRLCFYMEVMDIYLMYVMNIEIETYVQQTRQKNIPW